MVQGPFRSPVDVARLRDQAPRRTLRCSTEYNAEQDALREAVAQAGRGPMAQPTRVPQGATQFAPFSKTTQRAQQYVLIPNPV